MSLKEKPCACVADDRKGNRHSKKVTEYRIIFIESLRWDHDDILCRRALHCGASLHLRVCLLQLAVQVVERTEVGFGGGNDDVSICSVAINDTPGFLQSHSNLAL